MPAGLTNKGECFEHNCANFIYKIRNKRVNYCSTLCTKQKKIIESIYGDKIL